MCMHLHICTCTCAEYGVKQTMHVNPVQYTCTLALVYVPCNYSICCYTPPLTYMSWIATSIFNTYILPIALKVCWNVNIHYYHLSPLFYLFGRILYFAFEWIYYSHTLAATSPIIWEKEKEWVLDCIVVWTHTQCLFVKLCSFLIMYHIKINIIFSLLFTFLVLSCFSLSHPHHWKIGPFPCLAWCVCDCVWVGVCVWVCVCVCVV